MKRHIRVLARILLSTPLVLALVNTQTVHAQPQTMLVDTCRAPQALLKTPFRNDTRMNLLLSTAFTADNEPDRPVQIGARMNYLKWEIKGPIAQNFSFHLRQSLTKKALPGEADKAVHSVDYANIQWHPDKRLSLMAGKQLLCLGGYEFWVSGYKVKEFSRFNDNMNNYGTGLTATLHFSEQRSLSLQVVGSKTGNDNETFCYGLPQGINQANVPLLGTLNYATASTNERVSLRYSLSYGQQAAGCHLAYFTSGHVFRTRRLLAYFDLNASYEGLDHKGLVSKAVCENADAQPVTARHACYLSAIANADYRFSQRFGAFIKGIYECAGIARNNACYNKGLYFHEWQAQICGEYYPLKNTDLKFYLLGQFRERINTKKLRTLQAKHTDSQRISLGLVYAIPVF